MGDRVLRRALRIPMQDGIHLAADLYLPAQGGSIDETPRPVILERTPYDKSGPSRSELIPGRLEPLSRPEVAQYFVSHGYAVVMQDCRGRFESEGTFTKYINEAQDGYDTVQWIASQPWCNGRVGTMGLSYGAHTQSALAALAPSGLACMFLDSGGFSNAYQNGVRQGGAFEMKQATWAYKHALLSPLTTSNPARKAALDGVDIADWMRRTDWSPGNSPLTAAPEYEAYLFEQWRMGIFDDYWAQPSLNAEAFYDSFPDIPIAFVGSWYDPYVRACTENFIALSASKESTMCLVLGPWTHGDRSKPFAGDVDFGNQAMLEGNLAEDYLAMRLAWFDCHLAQRADAVPMFRDSVVYFRMGGGDGARNDDGRMNHGGIWSADAEWPPPSTQRLSLFLGVGCDLIEQHPTESGSLEFEFDPRNPVPTLGGSVTSGEPVMSGGAYDQRQIGDREDVLVFETTPLKRDLEVAGPVEAQLWVSSDAPDTDFTIKLVDVYPPNDDYPDGFAMNLCDGIFRMRFREGWETETTMIRGERYRITIAAFDTCNLFRADHRIRLEISSSNYPRFDVNPNTGRSVGDMSSPRIAKNVVFFGPDTPSRLVLRVNP